MAVHVKAVFVCMLCDPVLSDLLRWSLICVRGIIEVPVSYHQSPGLQTRIRHW